ncbi:MAG TPA: hypothetical protein VLA64_15125 [Azonexus sp.]|nr:hypothetical protein [Azonexus sp.]
MQRRRQHTEVDDVPVLTDAIDDEDDIPLLIDAEAPAQAVEPIDDGALETTLEIDRTEPAEPEAPLFNAALRDMFAHELAHRVKQRITAELPRIIESAVRDFLAEQEMISALPPHD